MTIYDFSARLGTGAERRLADYRGKVLLVVNVASKCGFTSQYIGLQRLYEQFRPRGFEILGFPCDQFGHQEPGSDAEIATFCDRT
jgi:glutathione peroxidase